MRHRSSCRPSCFVVVIAVRSPSADMFRCLFFFSFSVFFFLLIFRGDRTAMARVDCAAPVLPTFFFTEFFFLFTVFFSPTELWRLATCFACFIDSLMATWIVYWFITHSPRLYPSSGAVYLVLPSFTGLNYLYRPCGGFHEFLTQVYQFALGFPVDFMSFIEQKLVLLNFTQFYRILSRFTGFYWGLLRFLKESTCFIQFYRVLLHTAIHSSAFSFHDRRVVPFFSSVTQFYRVFFCLFFFYRCRYHRNGGGAKSSSSAELQLSARVASMTIADVSPRFALKVGPRYRVFSLSLSLSLSLSVLFFNRVGPSAAAGQSNAPVAVVDVE